MSKKIKKIKKIKEVKSVKMHFVQDSGVYKTDNLIAVGYTKKELIKIVKKYQGHELMLKEIEKQDWDTFSGIVIESDDNKRLLYMPHYINNWEHLAIFLHELHHLVFMIARHHNLDDEMEAQAYLYEYLLNKITKKINAK